MKHIKKHIIFIAFVHLLFLPSLWAKDLINTKDSIHLDSSIRYGQLPNGFTYYIKNVPGAFVGKMDFYVKVGSYYQEENELDFAHILEHLAFTTAENFPVHIVEELKKLNISDININRIGGHTGNLNTAYNLNIPLNNKKAVDLALLWFKDITDLKLTKESVDNERGVMRREVMYKVGNRLDEFFLETKLFSKLYSCKQNLSDFFTHNKDFSYHSLIGFYNKWYRPDKMGIIIAGEIKNIDKFEERVKKQFSNIPINKTNTTEKLDCRNNWMGSPNRFVSLTRKSKNNTMDNNSVKMFLFTRDKKTLNLEGTKEGIQRKYLWKLLTTMVNQRLIQNKELSGAFLLPPKFQDPFYQIVLSINDNSVQQKIMGISQFVQQIKVNGFTEQELEVAQEDLLRILGDTSSASYWAKQMSLHFTNHEILPENKKEFLKKWLTKLTIEEINSNVVQFLSDEPNDIGIIAPEGHRVSSYSESEIRGWHSAAFDSLVVTYNPYAAPSSPQFLTDQEITNLKKVSYINKGINAIGVEELELNNGVKIVMYSNETSSFSNDKIQIHGFRPKGASCFPESDYFSATNAPLLVKYAGVGNMDGKELNAAISNTSFGYSVYPYIEPFETGIKIGGKLKELEEMLQLVYLFYTNKPKINQKAYDHWKEVERRWYIEPSINPISLDFNVAMSEFLNDYSAGLKGGTKRFKGIAKTDKTKASQIYQELYSNASDFTFIITGKFNKYTILPLIQKYLGNLPNTDDVNCSSDDSENTELPIGPRYVNFIVNKNDTSYNLHNSVYYTLRFVSDSENPTNWKEHIKVVILGRLINTILSDFRYKKKAALYMYSGFGSYNRYLKAYNIGIHLQCESQELEWLRQECKKTIMDIKQNGFSNEQFDQVYNNSIKIWYEAKQERGLKPKEIYNYYRYNTPIIDKQEQERFVKSLTLDDIQQTAKKYLKKEYMLEFVMQGGDTNL